MSPDVDANGGKVYLTGRMRSTGGGSIKVLDGAYDINVKNNIDKDLQVGKLVSNDVTGLISITDTSKKKITEITRDSVKVMDYDVKNAATTPRSDTYTYNPPTVLRYNWTTGKNVTDTSTYKK